MTKQIAVVEDERDIRDNYLEALRRAGYQPRGHASRQEAEAAFAVQMPDLVLLDIGLGAERDAGMVLCQDLRARSKVVPIIILTNFDSESDVISGFRLGADDYLVKAHITMAQLLARVTALFRRQEALQQARRQEHVLDIGALRLDLERYEARWKDAVVDLTITEFEIVKALTRQVGHLRDRDTLMRSANIYVEPNTMTAHIKRIRTKFEAVDPAFSMIDTVYGRGYRWNGAAAR